MGSMVLSSVLGNHFAFWVTQQYVANIHSLSSV